MNEPQPLILGSASERRRRILQDMGVPFEVVVPEVEEATDAGDPARTAAGNALKKNEWCRARYPGRTILTADTLLDFEGRPVTKPATWGQAFEFMKMLSGREHRVLTAVALSNGGGAADVTVVASVVRFKILDDARIREYFSLVDPMDKAGAYDIDQRPELIIESYSGSRTNIMGLPAETVAAWLKERGMRVR
jgi:septum formation protein